MNEEQRAQQMRQELDNFLQIAVAHIPQPGDLPQLRGVDIHGVTRPLNGVIGGDHIVYLDFARRFDLERRIREASSAAVRAKLELNKHRAGILLADVAGHQTTDATLHIGLHHAFLTGVLYELDVYGEVTPHLFENLNTRFFQTANYSKFITMLYGEISETGDFAFLSAGHPPPVIYSREFGSLVDIGPDRLTTYYPIGMFPSEDDVDRERTGEGYLLKKRYTVNNLRLLSPGDIMVLFTDGLQELVQGIEGETSGRLEDLLRDAHDRPARQITSAILEALESEGPIEHDVSFVVVKRC
jgi:serine phosphatase RsbU (regulator of sigma subunit)